MFTKAEIEIYDLKLNDIIVTSQPDFEDDAIFPGGKIISDEE